jgi:peptidoglycan/LPS O-acetylase OafA/YrhL
MVENKFAGESVVIGQQLDYLDGWRGIAILLLLIGHFFPSPHLRLGTAGVHLFFVLSGFLMAKQLFLHRTPLPIFYKRRVSRIFPALYLFIAAMIIIYLTLGNSVHWKSALGATALVRNYYPEGLENNLPFAHIWSLSVEEHSYILLSLIAVALVGKINGQRTALGVLSFGCILMGAWYSSNASGFILYSTKLIQTEVAAFGIFFSSFLLLCFRNGIKAKIPSVVFYTLPVLGIASHLDVPFLITVFVGVGAFALMVNILHLAPAWMLKVLSFPVLRKLGLWSYSLYLWQQPFFVLKYSEVLSAPLALLLAMATGIVSYYAIESPARNYLNKTWAKKKAVVSPPELSDGSIVETMQERTH